TPENIKDLESILGAKVILLKNPRPELGLGGLVNVFRTAQSLNMHLDVFDNSYGNLDFVINLHEKLNITVLKVLKRKHLLAIRPNDDSYSLWSKDDYEDAIAFFEEFFLGAGWPSTTGNPSGRGRDNN